MGWWDMMKTLGHGNAAHGESPKLSSSPVFMQLLAAGNTEGQNALSCHVPPRTPRISPARQ